MQVFLDQGSMTSLIISTKNLVAESGKFKTHAARAKTYILEHGPSISGISNLAYGFIDIQR
jgi:hypothetical protein